MKTTNITFEDGEYKKLLKKKNGTSWHDFVLRLLEDDKTGKTLNKH